MSDLAGLLLIAAGVLGAFMWLLDGATLWGSSPSNDGLWVSGILVAIGVGVVLLW